MPSSSDQGKARKKDSPPVRSTGRTFAAIDPERVREVVPSAQRQEQPAADEAGHRSVGAVRVRQASQGGSEGGSGRR